MSGGQFSAEPVCKLCGDERLQPLYVHPSGGQLMTCLACGFRFFNVGVDNAPDYWATGGSAHNVEVYSDPDVASAERARHDRYLDLIEQSVSTGNLLDYGCGLGTFVERARARGWTARGVDTSPSAVAHAQSQGRPVQILDPDRGAEEPAWDGAFDAITLWDVLEHVDDPHATMRWITARLREGGLVAIETPDGSHALKRLALGLYRGSRGRLDVAQYVVYPDHRLYFTDRTLRRLMGEHKLEVVWTARTTTPTTKVVAKLRQVHRSGIWLPLAGRAALTAVRLTGGNKLVLFARKAGAGSEAHESA